jgi:membrane protein
MTLKERIENNPLVRGTIRVLREIKPPGFGGVSLYEVMRFFFVGLFEGFVTTRASAIAFSFFMAIFPFTLFLLTIIAYIPIDNFQEELLLLIQDVVPPNSYSAVESTIMDILSNRRGGLLSLGFILALFFANNGVNAIITGFYQSYHKVEFRNFFNQIGVSLGLTLTLSFLFILSIALIIFSEIGLSYLQNIDFISRFNSQLLGLAKWLIVLLLVFYSLSLLFYYGPAKQRQYHFVTPGGILATVLLIISSYVFSFYVSNFASYNKLYGSIGTLLIILVWIWINSLSLLIGFELNASIRQALRERRGNEEIKLKKQSEAVE